MKSVNLSVEFKDPIQELKTQLQRSGARNIDVKRNYNGEVEVRYSIACENPEKEITNLLSQAGAKDVRSSNSYSGARFDFKIDDMIDERQFKSKICDVLRRSNYRAN